jgi:hypothetical protein
VFSNPLIAGACAYAYVLAAIPPPAQIYRSRFASLCFVFASSDLNQPSRTPHTASNTATACPQEDATATSQLFQWSPIYLREPLGGM